MAMITRPKGATKNKKRLGRGPGSGHGTTAGKGTKGQNARSGGGVRLGFEGGQMPLYRRVASRGFSNYPFKRVFTGVNVSTLEKKFKSGATVNLESLREKGIVSSAEIDVKLLGNGDLTKKLKVEGLKVSRGAREKILAAGGSVDGEVASAPSKAKAEKPARDAKAVADVAAEADPAPAAESATEPTAEAAAEAPAEKGDKGTAKESAGEDKPKQKAAAKKPAGDGDKESTELKTGSTKKAPAKKPTAAKTTATKAAGDTKKASTAAKAQPAKKQPAKKPAASKSETAKKEDE